MSTFVAQMRNGPIVSTPGKGRDLEFIVFNFERLQIGHVLFRSGSPADKLQEIGSTYLPGQALSETG